MEGVNVEKFKNYFTDVLEDFEKNNKRGADSFEYKGDDVDLYNEEKEMNLSLKLQKRNLFYIKKVREALVRIEDGQFGTCEECAAQISDHRLLARPTAHLCINCKEEQEASEGMRADRVKHPSNRRKTAHINLQKFREKNLLDMSG
jgi:DnaK suppressor protein